MQLNDFDLIIVNSSAGKDSLCALWQIDQWVTEQDYPRDQVVVSHQDLGRVEWAGTKELAKEQADLFGFRFTMTRRRRNTGDEEDLLEYVERHGKWPSRNQRWCTSDLKRGPGARVITSECKKFGTDPHRVLYVFGFRAEESPARAKKKNMSINKRATTKYRTVIECYPIFDWTEEDVWQVIKDYQLPYHKAYDLGMPRLSCVFCIFSPVDALVVAGKANPELLDEYIRVEDIVGHTFRHNFSLREVREKIEAGYEPQNIKNWVM